MHFKPNQLWKIKHGKLAIGVEDQLSNAQLYGREID